MTETESQPERHMPLQTILGATLLLIGAAAAGLLSARHIWSINITGCGIQDGCGWALKSRWGNIAGWPAAYWGFGYFLTLLLLWLHAAQSRMLSGLRMIVRFAAIVSVGFIAIMIAEQRLCFWCLVTHTANLIWWGLVEFGARQRATARPFPRSAYALGLAAFLLIVVSAKLMEYRERLSAQEVAHRSAMDSIARIGGRTPAASVTPAPSDPQPGSRFGGRFWRGSPDAPVRIVVFQDYQCELCREVDRRLDSIVAQRGDVAISVKHWPFDESCNPYILAKGLHPNACQAARVAEAAGLLGGEGAFWSMHEWLFERGGLVALTVAETKAREIGLDVADFRGLVESDDVAGRVREDIREGIELGLTSTPMVFVNGYRVESWHSPGALPAAVERASQLALQHPRAFDQPEPALDRYLREWASARMESVPIGDDAHVRGPGDAPVTVVVFGDLTCPYHAAADSILESALEGHEDVRFVFYSFPLDGLCNDLVKREINPHACEAAFAAECAELVGGERAYWAMRRWLIDNRTTINEETIRHGATACGIDPEALLAARHDPRVSQRVHDDVELAKRLNITTSPTIFINGKRLRIWRTPGLVERAIQSARTFPN